MLNFGKIFRTISILAVLLVGFSASAQKIILPYGATGNGTFVVPPCVTSVTVQAWGAGGGGGYRQAAGSVGGYGSAGGGGGAYETLTLPVVPGETLIYEIGKGGTGGTDGTAVVCKWTSVKNGTDSFLKRGSAKLIAAEGGKGALDNTVLNNTLTYGFGGISTTSAGKNGGKGGNAGKVNKVDFGGGGGGAGHPGGNGGNGSSGTAGASSLSNILGGAGGKGGDNSSTENPKAPGSPGIEFGGGGGGSLKFSTGTTAGVSPKGGDGADGGIIITYIVNAAPTASVTTTTGTICPGDTANFTITGTKGGKVEYNLNGGTPLFILLSSAGTATISVPNATSSQTLDLMTVTFNGCLTDVTGQSVTKTVSPFPTLGELSATTACEGGSSIITATGLTPSSVTTIMYITSLTGSTAATINVTADINGNASYVTPNLPISYNGVVVTITKAKSASGCETVFINKSFTILIAKKGAASVSVNTPTSCSDHNALFTITGTAGATVTYKLNNGTNAQLVLKSNGTAVVEVAAATASQTITLVSIDNNGCAVPLSGTATFTIGGTTTWNGSAWSNGEPTLNKQAVIAGNYLVSANMNACTLTVINNAVIRIPASKSVTVQGAIKNNANSLNLSLKAMEISFKLITVLKTSLSYRSKEPLPT